jgi:hypothetical protein
MSTPRARTQEDELLSRIEGRLGAIEERLGVIERELAETRGAYRLARFVIALLGISGISGVAAWLSAQGK